MAGPASADPTQNSKDLETSFKTYAKTVTPLMENAATAHAIMIASAMQAQDPKTYATLRTVLRNEIKKVEALALKNIPELLDAGIRMSKIDHGWHAPLALPKDAIQIEEAKKIANQPGVTFNVRERFTASLVQERIIDNGKVIRVTDDKPNPYRNTAVSGDSEFYLVASTPKGEVPLVRFYASWEPSSIGNFAVYPVGKGEIVPPQISLGGVIPSKR
ncbi:MAG: hypothetical protein Q7S22_04060 [Candidatus Micrarchaeota archaeon]|nr:hypothetical protein [Candidatus Micrarchaeota archaeon]